MLSLKEWLAKFGQSPVTVASTTSLCVRNAPTRKATACGMTNIGATSKGGSRDN